VDRWTGGGCSYSDPYSTAQGRGTEETTMLTWETVKIAAYLKGYRYTITQGYNDLDEWEVEITDPDGDVVAEVFNTLEEAKEFCERTAREVQR
jgi:hypothetical protein